MAHDVVIRKVESKADFKAFFDFPWHVYKNDPNWVPPLLSMRHEILDKEKGPAWEYLEGDYFLAMRGNHVVGTIAAFINHRHNEFKNERVGWFGAFEVVDDAEAAAVLLNTAADWVQAKGCDKIMGPQTFTTHEDVGLLIDGFKPPVTLMPYHPSYYQGFIESCGFQRSIDMHSYYYDWEMVRRDNLEERIARITERIQKRGSIHIRPIDRKNLKHDFGLFKNLYNEAWVANWGFVPMTDRELDALIEGLQQIFDPDMACFAEIDGKAVGFIIVIPDFNQALHKAYPRPGTPELLTLLKVLWHWKIRPVITNTRIPLLGVVPEHRNKGVDLAMAHYALKAIRAKGYQTVDCGWILESNQDMAGTLKGFGMEAYKTYRLYERSTSQ